jgi:DNA-directed RNA polymerase
MAKNDSIPFVTPWFKARYPKISEPDTKGKFADGKFKSDGFLEDADYAAVEKALVSAGKKFWPEADVVSLPLKEFFANAEDKKAKKAEGRGFTLKSKYRPAVFDSKKKALPKDVKIGGGSVIRVASAIFPWSKAEKMKIKGADGKMTIEETTAYGVSLRLGDIQVRSLVEHQAQGDGSAFDEDEGGFEYEGTADAGDQFDGNSATDL